MGESGFHCRRHGEYVRPAGRVDLWREFPNDDDSYDRFLRGAPYHQDQFTGHDEGDVVELELVAERFNPHDINAVAVDYLGARVGYLPAEDAQRWHDVLLAANRAGSSIWARGVLDEVCYDDDGDFDPDVDDPFEDESVERLNPTLRIPSIECLHVLGDRFGLNANVHRLLETVDLRTREDMVEYAWERFPSGLATRVAAHAKAFPELTWPSSPPRGSPPRVGVPSAVYMYLRTIAKQERRRLQRQRQAELRVQRETHEAEVAERRQAKAQAAQAARALLLECVQLDVDQGMTNAQIAKHVGLSSSTVTKIRKELPRNGRSHNAFNEEQRTARLERSREALRLQRQGLTRAQIGDRMNLGHETVKMLLRDAKFYEDPATDQQRMDRASAAATAAHHGANRAKFQAQSGLSNMKCDEAWRDKNVLELPTEPAGGAAGE